MIDLKKLQQILQRTDVKLDNPKHVLINLFPVISTDKKADSQKLFNVINEVLEYLLANNIPIITISLGKNENILDTNSLKHFCPAFLKYAQEKKINVTVFGRWYDLPGELVEELKILNNETKEFDSFFLNLCINYDGKQEIADACRLIIRKILDEKIDIDNITPGILKENIYSSNLLPPDLIIEPASKFTGTFLWDSANAKIFFLKKAVTEINKNDIQKAFDWYFEKN